MHLEKAGVAHYSLLTGIVKVMNRGAFAVVWRNDKILLVKFPDGIGELSLKWALPGGLVDPGESSQQAAERETLEETGARVGAHSDHFYSKTVGANLELFFHIAQYIDGKLRPQEGETIDLGWFTGEEAIELDHAYPDTMGIIERSFT
ncbi:MAG: NUDIX domain-containing protein [Patescibacteria group bacterium]